MLFFTACMPFYFFACMPFLNCDVKSFFRTFSSECKIINQTTKNLHKRRVKLDHTNNSTNLKIKNAFSCCCIFQLVFRCWASKTLDEICIFNIFNGKKLKKDKKARILPQISCFFLLFQLFAIKNAYFNQQFGCTASC